jgi:hypothetical protein
MCKKYVDSSGGGTELDMPYMLPGFRRMTKGLGEAVL